MDRLMAGVVLGIMAAIWVTAYIWARDPHTQALMVFVGMMSAVRVISTSNVGEEMEMHHD